MLRRERESTSEDIVKEADLLLELINSPEWIRKH